MGSALHSYVKILKEVGYESSQLKVVRALFYAAQAKREIVEDTINSWLQGKSKCRVADYFDNEKISEEGKQGILNYFLSKHFLWEDLQKRFASDGDSKCVDCKTTDLMQFYESLVNEFLRCLNLPIEISEKHKEQKPSEESENLKKAKESEKSEEPQKKRMVDIFDQCIHNNPIEDFIVSDPSKSIAAYLFEDAVSVAGGINPDDQKSSAIDKPSDIDQKIIDFSKLLVSYMKCLKCCSETKKLLLDGYRPSPNMDSAAMEEIKQRRDELELFYTSLKEQVEQILNEEYEAKKRERKEKERQLWESYYDNDLL